MQSVTNQMVKGFDASHYQGSINWNQAKASGIEFAYVKASEGVTYTDPMFAVNVAAAFNAGVPVGAYHFAQPGQTAAVDEAKHFKNLLAANPTQLTPVLDLEAPTNSAMTADQLVTWVQAFLTEFHDPIMIYTGKWFADRYSDFNSAFAHLPLWASEYCVSAPADFGGWTEWTMWQYSDSGTVAGITGPVDLNVAVSLEAIGFKEEVPLITKEDAQKIIDLLGAVWNVTGGSEEAHRLANVVRVAAGIPTT